MTHLFMMFRKRVEFLVKIMRLKSVIKNKSLVKRSNHKNKFLELDKIRSLSKSPKMLP